MKKLSMLIVSGALLFGCSDNLDLEKQEKNAIQQVEVKADFENGRFVFDSRKNLSSSIKYFEDNQVSYSENYFESFYNKGFRSHLPIVNPENKLLQKKFEDEFVAKLNDNNIQMSSIESSTSNPDEEPEDSFIADPLLAAFVNSDNEIIVGDTLYKFIKEKGLFFSHIKDSAFLFDYVNKTFTTNEILGFTTKSTNTVQYNLEDGVSRVSENVYRYIQNAEIMPHEGGGGGGGGSYTPPPVQSPFAKEKKLIETINNLPITKGKRNFFKNLFGTDYEAFNYFDRRHRTKTQFWSQDWKFYSSTGILVRYQHRIMGFWVRKKTDELCLGINHILLRYKYSMPRISSPTHPQLFNSQKKSPIYMYDKKFIVKNNNGKFEFSFIESDKILPFFKFSNREILNIYIPLIDRRYSLNTSDIINKNNIANLFKMGFDFFRDRLSSQKDFAIIHQLNSEEISVLYFTSRLQERNARQIKKVLDREFGFIVGFGSNFQKNSNNFYLSSGSKYFKNYLEYNLDFFGMARSGSTWKGHRIVNTD